MKDDYSDLSDRQEKLKRQFAEMSKEFNALTDAIHSLGNKAEGHEDELSIEQIAAEVATILQQKLKPKDLLNLFQIVFLDVPEVAQLLRVKPETIQQWVSSEKIPHRKANGRVLFLLPEILHWTLPANDKHTKHRVKRLKA